VKLLLFVCKGAELIELSAFMDVFGWDTHYNGGEIEVVTCGFTRTVECCFNVPVKVQILIDEVAVDDYAALAIPGGFEDYGYYEDAFNEEFLELTRSFGSSGKPIASVCVGALPLAKSGVLKGRRATTYQKMGGKRFKQLEELGARAVTEPVVIEGNVITSAGPFTAMEVAFEFLGMLRTEADASRVREMMGF
jgi:4-methyl-5(b-hydroxyethyl)-thiazole monophosphate biosynthesis